MLWNVSYLQNSETWDFDFVLFLSNGTGSKFLKVNHRNIKITIFQDIVSNILDKDGKSLNSYEIYWEDLRKNIFSYQ